EAKALFRIQPRRRLIDNEQLGVIQERLGNTDALPHSAGETAERTLARFDEVHHLEQLLDSLARGLTIETFGRGEVFEELDRVQIRVNAEVLRKITQHCSQAIRRAENVHAIPSHDAARRLDRKSTRLN